MNFKIIIAFTIISLVIGVSIGAAEGYFLAKNDLPIGSMLQAYVQFSSSYIIELAIFYALFNLKISNPIGHAVAIVFLSASVSLSMFYFITGVIPDFVYLGFSLLVTAAAIASAYLMVVIRRQQGTTALQGRAVCYGPAALRGTAYLVHILRGSLRSHFRAKKRTR
ncbi:hypothetical protein [Microbulbifer hydrolyticus]|uniref:Uncharacterized protein n=1 Tax=Microbulbifer hydrolyticus TaxID=48074 RepID=A0A6P1T6V2_9GAMM|nr:hypothetical protein [Microbulbifer hydrolyticus]MBB5211508.1 hypothetical protein [Microbulbifer hydrolyticus]QHQ37747.1 hypothetical protein GTQ55_01260 [Microbulbifer hydrolyticus]